MSVVFGILDRGGGVVVVVVVVDVGVLVDVVVGIDNWVVASGSATVVVVADN